jgi:hypothetical protein
MTNDSSVGHSDSFSGQGSNTFSLNDIGSDCLTNTSIVFGGDTYTWDEGSSDTSTGLAANALAVDSDTYTGVWCVLQEG